MTRYKAFAIHLAISVTLIVAITVLFVWLWFPLPHFITEGGWKGVRLIAAVNCITGPLLTLIIYNPKKSRRELLLDLTAIALIQVLAMGAGLYTVSSKRVVAQVYADGTFYTLSEDRALEIGGELTSLIQSSKSVPAYVVVDMPDELDERQDMRIGAASRKVPIYSFDKLMIPLDEGAMDELSFEDVHPLKLPFLTDKALLEKYLEDHPDAYDSNYFIRTLSLTGDYLTLVSRKDFKLTGWIHGVYDKDKAPKPTTQ